MCRETVFRRNKRLALCLRSASPRRTSAQGRAVSKGISTTRSLHRTSSLPCRRFSARFAVHLAPYARCCTTELGRTTTQSTPASRECPPVPQTSTVNLPGVKKGRVQDSRQRMTLTRATIAPCSMLISIARVLLRFPPAVLNAYPACRKLAGIFWSLRASLHSFRIHLPRSSQNVLSGGRERDGARLRSDDTIICL